MPVDDDQLRTLLGDQVAHIATQRQIEIHPSQLIALMPKLFHLTYFPDPRIHESEGGRGTAIATKRDTYSESSDMGSRSAELALHVAWSPAAENGALLNVAWAAYDASIHNLSANLRVRPEMLRHNARRDHAVRFGAVLDDATRDLPPADAGDREIVLGPGETLSDDELRRLGGRSIRDYSGCAREEQLADLFDDVLPLGRYAFMKPDAPSAHGRTLYLGRYRDGARMAYNGVLVVAPINRGKTRLMMRWARAANRAGHNTLLVDVKGTLHAELAGRLRGRVLHFSTDPRTPCDAINFLAGLRWQTTEDRKTIERLVEAILPAAGWRHEGGDAEMRYHSRLKHLTAMVHLLLRQRDYARLLQRAPRPADLSGLYDLANSEELLYKTISQVQEDEKALAAAGEPIAQPDARWWIDELALLIDRKRMLIGQRPNDRAYLDFTYGILDALRPFAKSGALYEKIREDGAARAFSLDELGSGERVTIILAAREQDGTDAEAVVSMALRRLEQLLYDRAAARDPLTPILLLLDETARVRGFDAAAYITFARQAQAGCVLVYQSLNQIDDENKRKVLLDNVGTQIYLGSLSRNTAEVLIQSLPERPRVAAVRTLATGPQGRSETIQPQKAPGPYFNTYELANLPAGRRPALVYIRDHESGKPFFVDMDEALDTPFSVAADGTGDFTSLAEAVRRATPGSRLFVEPGNYREDVVIDKPIEIVATGPLAETLVQGIRVQGGTALVRGFGLMGDDGTVSVGGGRLVLEDCEVTAEDRGDCIQVGGSQTTAVVKNCRIFDPQHEGDGLAVWDGAEVLVLDSEFEGGRGSYGGQMLAVADGARVIVKQSRFVDTPCAVSAVRRGVARLEDCEIVRSDQATDADEDGQLELVRTRVHGGSTGLSLRAGRTEVDECDIRASGSAVVLGEGAALNMRRCRLEGTVNVMPGGRVARGRLIDCDIAGSLTVFQTELTFVNCRIAVEWMSCEGVSFQECTMTFPALGTARRLHEWNARCAFDGCTLQPRPLRAVAAGERGPHRLGYRADGRTLIGTNPGYLAPAIRAWNLDNGDVTVLVGDAARLVALSSGGRRGLLWKPPELVVIDLDTGAASGSITLAQTAVDVLAIDEAGTTGFASGKNLAPTLFDLETLQARAVVSTMQAPTAAAFSSDGTLLAVAQSSKRVIVIARGADRRWNLDGHPAVVSSLAFARGSPLLVTGDEQGFIARWNTEQWTPGATWAPRPGETVAVTSVAVAPGAGSVLVGYRDGQIAWVDLQSQQTLDLFRGGSDALFSPDGSRVLSNGPAGVHEWRVEPKGKGLPPV